MELEKVNSCPYCGSMNIVKDSKGQIICKECGLIYNPMPVITERIRKRVVIITTKPKKKVKKKPKKKAKKKVKKKKSKVKKKAKKVKKKAKKKVKKKKKAVKAKKRKRR